MYISILSSDFTAICTISHSLTRGASSPNVLIRRRSFPTAFRFNDLLIRSWIYVFLLPQSKINSNVVSFTSYSRGTNLCLCCLQQNSSSSGNVHICCCLRSQHSLLNRCFRASLLVVCSPFFRTIHRVLYDAFLYICNNLPVNCIFWRYARFLDRRSIFLSASQYPASLCDC